MATNCLDAETLAAWADDGLSTAQKTAVESHLSQCARCQSLVASLSAAMDDGTVAPVTGAAPVVVPFARRRPVYWLPIAAGTVAATLLIWVQVGRQEAVPDSMIARDDRPMAGETTGGAQPEPLRRDQSESRPTSAPPREELRARPGERPAGTVAGGSAAKAEKPAADATLAESRPRPVLAAPPPPAAPVPIPAATPSPVSIVTQAPPPAAAAKPVPPPVTGQTGNQAAATQQDLARRGLAGGATFRASVEDAVIAQFTSGSPAATETLRTLPTGRAGGRGGGGGGIAASVAKQSGPVTVHWRILSSGLVHRSVDLTTWEPVIVPAEPSTLLTGAAPSPATCWLIGRNGLVLLSTDGQVFTRVRAPAPVDLTGIVAIDAARATVTASDGRTFRTEDGGKTWTQLATDR